MCYKKKKYSEIRGRPGEETLQGKGTIGEKL